MIFLGYINHGLSLLNYSSDKDFTLKAIYCPWAMSLPNKINQDLFLLMLSYKQGLQAVVHTN
jgi:hypothetical protein